MANFKGGSLEIILDKKENSATISWRGKSDDRNPSVSLDPYFDSIIGELKGLELSVDFLKLEYMNSSTVPPIIKFLKDLNANEINSVFIYDASSKWQAASFKAFETFSKMLPHISVQGK